jgi:hypothetical protein
MGIFQSKIKDEDYNFVPNKYIIQQKSTSIRVEETSSDHKTDPFDYDPHHQKDRRSSTEYIPEKIDPNFGLFQVEFKKKLGISKKYKQKDYVICEQCISNKLTSIIGSNGSDYENRFFDNYENYYYVCSNGHSFYTQNSIYGH